MTKISSEDCSPDDRFIDCILDPEEFLLSEEDYNMLFGLDVHSPEEIEETNRKRRAERVPADPVDVDIANSDYIKSYSFGGSSSHVMIKIERITLRMNDFEIHRMCEVGRAIMLHPKDTVYNDENKRNVYFQMNGAPSRIYRGAVDQITGELRDSYTWSVGAVRIHLTRRQLHDLLCELELVRGLTMVLRDKYRSENK